jgi:hypothetical protein
MHKVLKRIVALPAIPQDETFEIKNRAVGILKGWRDYLEEIATMPKEKGSGSDDKSPVKPKDEETKEGDAKPGAELEVEETKSDEEKDEDFVVVEGGGEDDVLAQEKAAEKVEDKMEDKVDVEEKDTEADADAQHEPASAEAMGTSTSASLI